MAFDGYDSDDESGTAPVFFLASSTQDPADIVAEEDAQADSSKRLAHALNGLDPRSRNILQQRWLRDDKATLHELAEEYGVSAERIRQLEQNAIKKLKKAIAA
jgi:RNA polymerase sigma-32 factor